MARWIERKVGELGLDSRRNALVALVPALYAMLYLGASDGNAYGPSHYFLTYEFGFVKRGLLGQLLLYLFPSFPPVRIAQVSYGAMLAVMTSWYWIFRSQLFGRGDHRWLLIFLFSLPAALSHFAYIAGQLDVFLFLVGTMAMASARWRNPIAALVSSTFFCLVGLLIHEAFLLMVYPAVFFLLLDRSRDTRWRWLPGMQASTVMVFFVFLLQFGKLKVPIESYLEAAAGRTSFEPKLGPFHAMTLGLREQVESVMAAYRPDILIGAVLGVAVSIPLLLVLLQIFRRYCDVMKIGSKTAWCMMLAFASPLLLSVVGHDVMRWFSAAVMNLALYLAFSVTAEKQGQPSQEGLAPESQLMVATIWSFAIGPFGIFSARVIGHARSIAEAVW